MRMPIPDLPTIAASESLPRNVDVLVVGLGADGVIGVRPMRSTPST